MNKDEANMWACRKIVGTLFTFVFYYVLYYLVIFKIKYL